nr:hypothetical protein [Tanacetum cinerariifolium]
MMNELVRNQCDVTNHHVNVQFLLQLQPEWQRSQQAVTRNRGKAIVNSPLPMYDQEPSMVTKDDEIANQDNSPRINRGAGECQKPKRAKDAAYHREKMLLYKQEEARIQLNAEQADWRDDIDDESEDQELEVHYMYMAQIQEVSLDAADSGPIFDSEPLQKASNDDHYNVFVIESEHHEQSKSIHDTYPIEQDEHNVIIDSLDMSYDRNRLTRMMMMMILPINLLLDFNTSGHHSSITVTRLLTDVNMSLTDINASLTENNLHLQCKLFNRGNSSTSSGKIH